MRYLSVAVVAVAFALAGCGSNPLVGKWKMDGGDASTTIMEFKGDGTFTMTMEGVPLVEQKGPMVAAEGKWSLKDKDLTLNIEKSPLAEELTKTLTKMGGKAADIPAFKPETRTEKAEVSGDTLTITDKTANKTQAFTRVK